MTLRNDSGSIALSSGGPGLRRVLRVAGWWLMALLAFAVAGYALGLTVLPEIRPSMVRDLFAEKPLAAAGHFIGGSMALIVGALQTNGWLRRRHLGLHRWLGRVYVLAVLAGGVAALTLAAQGSGGLLAQLGFGLLGIVWLLSTALAWRYIRVGNRAAHRDWMLRSYALCLAAVTLRLYLPAGLIAGLPFTTVYPGVAWLCWVPNLLLIEWYLRARPVRVEASPLALGATT